MEQDGNNLIVGSEREPSRGKPKRLRRSRRRLSERGLDRHVDRRRIPYEAGRSVEQSPETTTGPEGSGQGHEIEFTTYTPLGTPTHSGPYPPDPSGADGTDGVVLYTGNSYLMASTDGGQTFTEHDTTVFLPAAQARPVDMVMTYVPHRRLFAWMMQHMATPITGEGNFRLAVAHVPDLRNNVETAWTVYDFTSTDLGAAGVATDRQDLAFSESHLYMTTNLVGRGRVVMSLNLDDLDQGRGVHWTRTDPLDRMYQFSDLSQQNGLNVRSVAIASNSRLQVMTLDDAAGTYGFNDVTVGQFPEAEDLQSLDPDGVDWLTKGVANVSASLVQGNHLWVSWDAASSPAGETPVYPNAHVRFCRIDMSTWTTVQEHQVWNPDYAFAYGCLATGNGDVAYGVAVGGSGDYPNTCFGILGDFVVYFRDGSTATPGADIDDPRFGDYLTVRPSTADSRRYAAFGYFVEKVGSSAVQRPYFLSYGRP